MSLEAFFNHFEQLADAPNGVQKLRELILQLAVQGKLVPQDSSNEQVAIDKPLPIEIGIQNVPELPKHWLLLTVSDACSHVIDCPHSTPKFTNKGYFCIDTNCISQGKILFDKARYVTEDTFQQRVKRLIPEEGDILFSREGTIGVSAIVPKGVQLCLGQRMMMYRPHKFLNSSYFLHFLTSPFFKKQLFDKTTGTAAKHVNIGDIRKMVVVLPPLEEQKRIVSKVDRLMQLCDELEERQRERRSHTKRLNEGAIAQLLTTTTPDDFTHHWQRIHNNFDLLYSLPENITQLRQAILQLAVQGKLVPQDPIDTSASDLLEKIRFEKNRLLQERKLRKVEVYNPVQLEEIPFSTPQGWLWERFGQLAEIVSGVTKGRNLAGRKTASYPYLRVANVQRGFLDLSVMKEIDIPVEELSKYRLQAGDILLTEGGDWDKLGRSAIWHGEIADCIHQNHVFRARLFHVGLSSDWAILFTNSPVGRQYFETAAKKTTNLASINMTQLRHCPFPVPPIEEQKRIVAKVDRLMALCDRLEAELERSQSQSGKLMEAAVRQVLAS